MKSLFHIILVLCTIQNAFPYAKWKCLFCDTSKNKQFENEYDQGHEGICQSSETNVGCLSVTQSTKLPTFKCNVMKIATYSFFF